MTEGEYESLKESLDDILEHGESCHFYGISSIMSKYEKAKSLKDEIDEEVNKIRRETSCRTYHEALSQARKVVLKKRRKVGV